MNNFNNFVCTTPHCPFRNRENNMDIRIDSKGIAQRVEDLSTEHILNILRGLTTNRKIFGEEFKTYSGAAWIDRLSKELVRRHEEHYGKCDCDGR